MLRKYQMPHQDLHSSVVRLQVGYLGILKLSLQHDFADMLSKVLNPLLDKKPWFGKRSHLENHD
jgi:hypothetical protein